MLATDRCPRCVCPFVQSCWKSNWPLPSWPELLGCDRPPPLNRGNGQLSWDSQPTISQAQVNTPRAQVNHAGHESTQFNTRSTNSSRRKHQVNYKSTRAHPSPPQFNHQLPQVSTILTPSQPKSTLLGRHGGISWSPRCQRAPNWPPIWPPLDANGDPK